LNSTLDSFATSIATFVSQTYVDDADAVVQATVTAETSARAAAVTTLEGADTTLQTNITSEETDRLAADSALSARLVVVENLFITLNSSTPTI
jgi:hypothetical protein